MKNGKMLLLFALYFILLLIFTSNPAFAKDKKTDDKNRPLWEIGLVGIGGYVPDYPGSDESSGNGIVMPYMVYRGKFFRMGDKGIARGRFINTDSIEFDLSLDGSFDAESDDNSARAGMPDLDYLFEIGPRLQIKVMDNIMGGKLEVELPFRAVLATDFSYLSYEGLVFQPSIAWQRPDLLGTGGNLKIYAGPIFFTEKLMDYFYEVKPAYTRTGRPNYDAGEGYLGTELGISAIKKINNNFTLFGSLQLNFYEGSANDDSPLFQRDFSVGIRIGVMYSLFKSKTLISDK